MSVRRIIKNASQVVSGTPQRRGRGRAVRRGGVGGQGGLTRGLEGTLRGVLGGRGRRR